LVVRVVVEMVVIFLGVLLPQLREQMDVVVEVEDEETGLQVRALLVVQV
jgi:hypothetical protein